MVSNNPKQTLGFTEYLKITNLSPVLCKVPGRSRELRQVKVVSRPLSTHVSVLLRGSHSANLGNSLITIHGTDVITHTLQVRKPKAFCLTKVYIYKCLGSHLIAVNNQLINQNYHCDLIE